MAQIKQKIYIKYCSLTYFLYLCKHECGWINT